MKHKSVDYKLSAVNYYLNHEDGYDNTCKIFDCKKSSLKRWIHKYKTSKNLTRRNREPISYKITKPQVNTALELLKKNEQLTMNELAIDIKKKYPSFDITPQHLGQIIRDNNKTRKRTRHEHFPKERYKKPIEKENEMNIFPNYKYHLIILDNAGSHNNELIKNAIIKSGNTYLFAVPYTPRSNLPIEAYFNQIKTYMEKDRNVGNYQQLEHNVDKAIEKVKKENYKNYFEYAYNLKEGYELKRKPSTRRRKLKIYK